MAQTQQDFAAAQYGPRAKDYLASAVHAAGPDLDQIEAQLKARAPGDVLDLGCGGGHVSYRAAPFAKRVVACDLTPMMLETVRETAQSRGFSNIETVEARAENLPFADASFDWVLCRFTAHHWADLDAGLREAFRVLKPGGASVMIDTIAPEHAALDTHLQAIEVLRDPSHARNYRASEWIAALGRVGFTIESTVTRALKIAFADWTARTRTPESHIAVLRMLMREGHAPMRAHYKISDACDFELGALACMLTKPSA